MYLDEETINKRVNLTSVEKVFSVGYYSLIAVVAIFGNLLIIFAVSKIRKVSADLITVRLIQCLAVNDLLSGLILYPHFILLLSLGYFPFPPNYCLFLGFFEIYCPICSTLMVTSLVITKVCMLRNPFLSLAQGREYLVIAFSVYVGALYPPVSVFVGFGSYMFSPERGTCTYSWYPAELGRKLNILICVGVYVVVPFSIIIVLSLYILKFASRYRKQVRKRNAEAKTDCYATSQWSSSENIHQSAAQKKAKERIIKSTLVVLMVVAAFIICWSMFCCVATSAFIIGGEDTIPRQVLLWQKALLMTNNAVNPLVYMASNARIQKTVKMLFLKFFKKNSISEHVGNTTLEIYENVFTKKFNKTTRIVRQNAEYLETARLRRISDAVSAPCTPTSAREVFSCNARGDTPKNTCGDPPQTPSCEKENKKVQHVSFSDEAKVIKTLSSSDEALE